MIIRIVELSIEPGRLDDAKQLLKEVAPKVRAMKGCSFLEILNDIHDTSHFTTYSYWDSEADLNAYRDSETFMKFWRAIKPHFKAKARAWSSTRLVGYE
jgi:quinol monooxygenase YgiN